MAPLRVWLVLGTRPEVIKLAPVVHALRDRPDVFAPHVCVTGQHREMVDSLLELFEIEPDLDLDLMTPGQAPAGVAGRVLERLGEILPGAAPDWVVVQGDTTSAAAGALAAHYARVPVAHVEAGLRSHDPWQPFPEETNRRVIAAIAHLHFAPTAGARRNLLREGVGAEQVRVTGNTVVDALHWVAERPLPPHSQAARLLASLPAPSRVVLVTAHRRENLGAPLERICGALATLVRVGPDPVEIVFPVHLNPRVDSQVRARLDGVPGIHLLPPLDYPELVHVLRRADLVLTDSGGLQEEAPSLARPVLVLREVTERPEAIEAGTARLVGTDPALIVRESVRLLADPGARAAMTRSANPFGDGRAAGRIAAALAGVEALAPMAAGLHPEATR